MSKSYVPVNTWKSRLYFYFHTMFLHSNFLPKHDSSSPTDVEHACCSSHRTNSTSRMVTTLAFSYRKTRNAF